MSDVSKLGSTAAHPWTHAVSWYGALGMLALVTALTAACGPVEAGRSGDPNASEIENVGVIEQELSTYYQHHFGGHAFEKDEQILMGAACTDGYVRDYYTVWHNGNGNCWALGWASPDPRDCKVRVNLHFSGGFLYGDCHLQVEQKPGAASCAERCGLQAPSGCWCDSQCTTYGDCCADYDRFCARR